jgi:exopolysaccharide production protein ExoZ
MTAAWLVPGALLHYLGNPLILEFLFGLLIARLPTPRGSASVMLPLGAGVLFIAPTLSFNGIEALHYLDTAALRVVWCGIPCALIFYGALALEGRLKSKAWDVPVLVGNASYSIYLFHYFVTESVPDLLGFVCAIGVGLSIYWVIERRIIRLGALLRERPREPVLVVTANG